MELIITGRKGSGKTTAANILLECYEAKEPLIITEVNNLKDLVKIYNQEKTKVLLIDCSLILARSRLVKQIRDLTNYDEIKEEDLLIKHLTELDKVHIISNNLEISNFRLKIKRFAKSL